jgi:hypothetical protein
MPRAWRSARRPRRTCDPRPRRSGDRGRRATAAPDMRCVIPPAIEPRSTTITFWPAAVSSYAADRPAIPSRRSRYRRRALEQRSVGKNLRAHPQGLGLLVAYVHGAVLGWTGNVRTGFRVGHPALCAQLTVLPTSERMPRSTSTEVRRRYCPWLADDHFRSRCNGASRQAVRRGCAILVPGGTSDLKTMPIIKSYSVGLAARLEMAITLSQAMIANPL